jgi:DNA polymerase-3 subunit gamma/tau
VAQALYRKWRPTRFDDVVGQEHVTTTLKNQIATGRVGHAYLFVGSRGCGKTTSARIFAKEINIAGLEANNPRAAQIAKAIEEGRSLDLIEIDAASNNSVEDVREIRDKVGFQPTELKYKVYIIDEVHMLSVPAFNALLKTLEEPPAHVIFILATTDPQKIPATVLSRCQRFNFKRVPVDKIVSRLRKLCDAENIEADEQALRLIARNAGGALRDAESLLDQLASASSALITATDVREALGATDAATVKGLVDGLISKTAGAGFEVIQQAIDQGADARQIARQTVEYLRALMQVKAGAGAGKATGNDLSEGEKMEMSRHAEQLSMATIARATRAFSGAINEMRSATDAQLPLEMAYLDCIVDEPVQHAPSAHAAVAPEPTTTQPQSAQAPEPSAKRNGTGANPTPTPAAVAHSDAFKVLDANWMSLIKEVNTTNKAAAALLRSCHAHDVVGRVVQIRADHDLAKTRLEDAKNKASVLGALRKMLGDEDFGLMVFVGQPPVSPDDDPVLKAARRLGGTVRE